ncbi:MAG: putative hydro-lyase [Chloroflexota bacterium]|nr:putative hydro-lyase [Chloroflexota bacterium]
MTLTALPENPADLRRMMRDGDLVQPTSGMAPGHVQANLAILPRDLAFDFLLFCQRNPRPCPLLEVVEAGEVEPREFAPGADIRTDLPLYRVYEHGELTAEITDLREFWRDDLVSFLLGCSFSFETALMRVGMEMRHMTCGTNVPMFITNIDAASAGAFSGPMVVSMRPIPQEQVVRAVQVTSRFPAVHGAPVHVGNPAAIGIGDIYTPDFGEPVEFKDGEVPVFWACGVTPQAVAMNAKPPLMITHAPGHMFITDKMDEDLAVI